jgi:hypothetical protein
MRGLGKKPQYRGGLCPPLASASHLIAGGACGEPASYWARTGPGGAALYNALQVQSTRRARAAVTALAQQEEPVAATFAQSMRVLAADRGRGPVCSWSVRSWGPGAPGLWEPTSLCMKLPRPPKPHHNRFWQQYRSLLRNHSYSNVPGHLSCTTESTVAVRTLNSSSLPVWICSRAIIRSLLISLSVAGPRRVSRVVCHPRRLHYNSRNGGMSGATTSNADTRPLGLRLFRTCTLRLPGL